VDGRRELFRINMKSVELDPDVDLELLAQKSGGYSGADVANVCRCVCMYVCMYVCMCRPELYYLRLDRLYVYALYAFFYGEIIFHIVLLLIFYCFFVFAFYFPILTEMLL
jgi:hypothetical protein